MDKGERKRETGNKNARETERVCWSKIPTRAATEKLGGERRERIHRLTNVTSLNMTRA